MSEIVLPVVTLQDLAFNENGILTQEALFRAIEGPIADWHAQGLPSVNIFSGGRVGNDPSFMKNALLYGNLLEQNQFYIVNGGGKNDPQTGEPEGLMAACIEGNSRVYSFVPNLFANETGSTSSEGLNPNVYNIRVRDMYERECCMMQAADNGVIGLSGGIGTFREVLQAMLFGKTVYFDNLNGCWQHAIGLLKIYEKLGLLPQEKGRPLYRVTDGAENTVATILEDVKKYPARPKHLTGKTKPAETLHAYLHRNPDALLTPLMNLLSQNGKRDWMEVPRVGVVASSHIGLKDGRYNFVSHEMRHEMVENSKKLGLELGMREAALIITGSPKGLRKQIAKTALKNKNSSVIWIQKVSDINAPLEIERIGDREIRLLVAREHEVDRAAELIAHSFLGIAGGPNSTSRILGIATREHTGCRPFADLGYPKDFKRNQTRICQHVYSPAIDDGIDLFGGVMDHLLACVRTDFFGKNDYNTLIHTATNATTLVDSTINEGAKRSHLHDPLHPVLQAQSLCFV